MQDETIKDTEVKDQNQQCECQKSDCEACSKESEPTQTAQAQEENAQNTAEKEPSVEELLAAAKEENAKLQDLYMRALAEAENARRRAEESVEKAHKFGVEKFAKNLLPVLDSLEKALELNQNADDPMMQGVQATYRQFVQAMEKSGMTEINPVGEKFDPTRHQAIAMVPAQEGQSSGQVAQVFQRGWLISDRVLRAAMVSVVQ
ncbi:nucleotide exchange factor GrpE [Parasutterella secunda]|uniref:Protein GrpE n=1 Tax=Parasutterella secunda TaxID=626947 RepID=A0ABS2GST1_9BURK|nr:nucleotide exchange factor GrpE [Parasutterella secunda]MBM6928853.1 nucleotide exchange factor GrpE [Parasutterella secunda]